MTTSPLLVQDYGDSAVMVTSTSADPGERAQHIAQLRRVLVARRPHGVTDLVAGLESLLVTFDPLVSGFEHLAPYVELAGSLAQRVEETPGRVIDVPVVFDADAAPDLADVAVEQGCEPGDVIASLCAHDLSIELLAAAMAPMMSGVRLPRPVSRQARPRTDVPAGSIMIARAQAIIQPFPGPTGWKVVGWTPLAIVDIAREPAITFAVGDRFRLRPIDRAEAAGLHGRVLGDDHA